MLSSPKACRESGCGKVAVADARGYCLDHKRQNSCAAAGAERYKHDPVSKMYGRVRWTRFRTVLLAQNPLCQKINRGIRCTRPSCIGHHLQSPRVRPDLFTDHKNVIAVCEFCHGPEEGTPWYRVGVDYVPTEFEIRL
jgi:hypothetical protein